MLCVCVNRTKLLCNYLAGIESRDASRWRVLDVTRRSWRQVAPGSRRRWEDGLSARLPLARHLERLGRLLLHRFRFIEERELVEFLDICGVEIKTKGERRP